MRSPSSSRSTLVSRTIAVLPYFVPFFDPEVRNWSLTARLLRWLTLVWLLVGLAVLFSASYPVADAEYGDGLYYFKRQLIWIYLGLLGFNFCARVPLRSALKMAKVFMLVCLGLIIMTLIPGLGMTVNGATRWVAIASFPLQPSELIKPFLVLQSAVVFGRWSQLRKRDRLLWIGIFALLLGCILLQPNLSTAALCGITLWLIALAAGLPLLQLGGTGVGGLVLATVSISLREYQQRRVMSFLNPWADPMGDGYQLIQSLLAVGSGETWGAGFGLSQQKLFYLPIQYTDFIFSVFAEEFGFAGSMALLSLLTIYATVALVVALKSSDGVKKLVAMGAMILLVGQSLINIGVATGALPTTGLPLPLFSYGGSSAISSLILAGLLVRAARESNEAPIVTLGDRRPQSSQTPQNASQRRLRRVK
ncbi:MAG: FtsW/RodA/SpoVE family cell cycle protein [Jaaginema sp. PMC 1079.18]|nr:FtsW/RodA/SpoVE family cell cycle protein [Jaaginema sp. PMC 1080.18]MEC4851225.1 FtsW/RodA/SpoVE family cell cycle protein [Jaaginema sp. PMC 1079.18]MEC4867917.1 FtsW/RodA/SpoVE family cell cycle protein [Jaaginema sp. PMC 1078.18]